MKVAFIVVDVPRLFDIREFLSGARVAGDACLVLEPRLRPAANVLIALA